MKLRDFSVGDTVTLIGAGAVFPALFLGDIDRYGYHQLWKNKQERLDDKPWFVAAAGSHRAEKA